jgi:putative lipoic acid-binding regulatory protein
VRNEPHQSPKLAANPGAVRKLTAPYELQSKISKMTDDVRQDDQPDNTSLIAFPCEFSVKAMGLAETGFDALVVEIVRRHVPGLGEGAVRSRSSSGGKYTSVTVTFNASSREQLDAIYQALTDHERVLMSL